LAKPQKARSLIGRHSGKGAAAGRRFQEIEKDNVVGLEHSHVERKSDGSAGRLKKAGLDTRGVAGLYLTGTIGYLDLWVLDMAPINGEIMPECSFPALPIDCDTASQTEGPKRRDQGGRHGYRCLPVPLQHWLQCPFRTLPKGKSRSDREHAQLA